MAATGFFHKISSGVMGLMRIRELHYLCDERGLAYFLALYFATVSWYFHNIIIDKVTEWYIMVFVYMTLWQFHHGPGLHRFDLFGGVVSESRLDIVAASIRGIERQLQSSNSKPALSTRCSVSPPFLIVA